MSSIEIRAAQFPQAVPNHLAVGDNVRLTVTARITRIAEDQIDVSPYGSPLQFVPGERTTGLTILTIEPAA